jgi:hypothetical protein
MAVTVKATPVCEFRTVDRSCCVKVRDRTTGAIGMIDVIVIVRIAMADLEEGPIRWAH